MAELHYRYGRPTTLADLAPGTLFEVEATGLRFVKKYPHFLAPRTQQEMIGLADGITYSGYPGDTRVRPIEFRELGPKQKPVNPEDDGA